MSEAIPPLSNTPSWRGAQLKNRDNFIVYLSPLGITNRENWFHGPQLMFLFLHRNCIPENYFKILYFSAAFLNLLFECEISTKLYFPTSERVVL
jgi:hypothetical protein